MTNNDDIQSLIISADKLFRNQKWEQANATIKKVLEIQPNDIESLKIYAESLVKLNRTNQALIVFEKALQLSG